MNNCGSLRSSFMYLKTSLKESSVGDFDTCVWNFQISKMLTVCVVCENCKCKLCVLLAVQY